MSSEKLDYPATGRNTAPILEVLRRVLPSEGRVLEVASGSGQHVAAFAPRFAGLRWQPTDFDEDVLPSIAAWSDGLANVEPPRRLDVCQWTVPGPFDVIYCANMIHIAPFEATLGLLGGAGEHLVEGGTLILYGPFRRAGEHTAPSNEAFDRRLQSRDSRWGVRDLDVVSQHAAAHGLSLGQVFDMPANNLTAVFSRA